MRHTQRMVVARLEDAVDDLSLACDVLERGTFIGKPRVVDHGSVQRS
jgi:hypothetical protein